MQLDAYVKIFYSGRTNRILIVYDVLMPLKALSHVCDLDLLVWNIYALCDCVFIWYSWILLEQHAKNLAIKILIL